MTFVSLFLNIPWSIVGIIFALFSIPYKITVSHYPKALIFKVKSLYWYKWLPKMGGIRAMAIGNIVILSKNILQNDLEHELIHVTQFEKAPLIHPFLYEYENLRKGYDQNKYEIEAREKSATKNVM